MIDLFASFTVGLLGSLHCVGMCGPIVLAYSLSLKQGTTAGGAFAPGLHRLFSHHAAFHSGRILTYAILGAIVAAAFHSLEVQKFSALYRAWIAVFCGILLIVFGLVLMRIAPVPSFLARLVSPGYIGRKIASLAGLPGVTPKIGLGLAAGLIPCGLSWAMLVNAASTLDPAKGFMTMASFGLGTAPALLLTGMSASFISTRKRLLGERAAAAMVIVMGVFLLGKGAANLLGFVDCCSGF